MTVAEWKSRFGNEAPWGELMWRVCETKRQTDMYAIGNIISAERLESEGGTVDMVIKVRVKGTVEKLTPQRIFSK